MKKIKRVLGRPFLFMGVLLIMMFMSLVFLFSPNAFTRMMDDWTSGLKRQYKDYAKGKKGTKA